MDLKGSLVDTKLKIFPSDTLQKFLENIDGDDIPANIIKFTKNKDRKPIKNETATEKSSPVQLNKKDFENLYRIISVVKKINSERPPAEETGDVSQSKSELSSDNKEMSQAISEEPSDDVLVAREGPYLVTSDIDWLFSRLQKKRTNGEKDIPYLHALLERSYIETPQNKILKRNPDLEARCVKLRAQQEAREYRQMTKGVDNVRMRFPEDSISYQCKYFSALIFLYKLYYVYI